MWIPLETAFVNPDNILPLGASCLTPNVTIVECDEDTCGGHVRRTREECDEDTEKYFIDEDLLARFLNCVTLTATIHASLRIPNCFLLIGGIIAILSVLGLLLVREPETGRGQKTEKKQLDDSELPSLDAKEVLRTPLFYKVASSHRQLIKKIKLF